MIETTAAGDKRGPIVQDFRPRELAAEELRFSAKLDPSFASTEDLIGTKEFAASGRNGAEESKHC